MKIIFLIILLIIISTTIGVVTNTIGVITNTGTQSYCEIVDDGGCCCDRECIEISISCCPVVNKTNNSNNFC